MARRCTLTGVGVQTGNNVSHANNKTRRRFMPNMQKVSLQSDILGVHVSLKLNVAALRMVEHNGGLDNFLLTTKAHNLTEDAKRLRRRVKKALEAKQAKAA